MDNVTEILTTLGELKVSVKHTEQSSSDTRSSVKELEQKLEKTTQSLEERLRAVETSLSTIKGLWLTITMVSVVISIMAGSSAVIMNILKASGH